MRDGLTVLAGLVLLALVSALALPLFVDWNQHRAVIEEQLKRATGIDLVTTGPIQLRFLPSPRIGIAGVRLGDADPRGTRATAANLSAEMALAPLMRGEVIFDSVRLDGLDLTLATSGGALVLPEAIPLGAVPGVGHLSVTRGLVRVLDHDGATRMSAPFALEAVLPHGPGPSRVEGEIAGLSVRLTTGDRDPAGRIRAKLAGSDSGSRAEFDGWIGLERRAGRALGLRPDGQATLTLLGEGEGQPLLTAAARVEVGAQGLKLSSLSLDAGAAGRLEGDAAWTGEPGEAATINLQSRRTDLGAWLGRDAALDRALRRMAWLTDALPDADLRLALDQLSYRGEEATEAQLALQRRNGAWRPSAGQLKFAGASLSFAGRGGGNVIEASLDAPDLRRIALAMQRLDMPQGLAEDIAGLGQLAGSAELSAEGEGWRIHRWQARGRFGQASGAGEADADRIRLSASFTGADILFLVRPLGALAALAPQTLDVSLSGQSLRIGDSAAGAAELKAQRLDGHWRVDALSARGFDGLELNLRRGAVGEPLRLTLAAARADAISALAERLSPSRHLTQMLRAVRDLSPVRLEGAVSERADMFLVTASGKAGPLTVDGSGRFSLAGAWQGGEVSLASPQRGTLFRALGLPEPQQADVGTSLAVRFGAAGPTLILTGADGLSAEARGVWAAGAQAGQAQPAAADASAVPALAGPLEVNFTAPSPGALLPALAGGAGRGGDGEMIQGRFRLRLDEAGLGFDAIEARYRGQPVTGALTLATGGAISGRLAVPQIEIAPLAGLLGVTAMTAADGNWSGARFSAAPAVLRDVALQLESPSFILPLAGAMAGSLRFSMRENLVSLADVKLTSGDLSLRGTIEGQRNGGTLAIRANGDIAGLDLGRVLGGDFGGAGTLSLQLGASGESPARIAATLAGSGQFAGRMLAIRRLDPSALDRFAAGVDGDIMVADAATLARSVRQTVEAGGWTIAETTMPFVVAAGVARLSPVTDEKPAASLTASGALDLRSGVADLRAAMQARTAPKGWNGAAPQLAVTWRGDWRAPQRGYDVSALSNALSQRALQREIERVEALEADIRERAAFNRRLRAEREKREEEIRAAAEAKAREEREREERAREEKARVERARQEREQALRVLTPIPGLPWPAQPQPAERAPVPPPVWQLAPPAAAAQPPAPVPLPSLPASPPAALPAQPGPVSPAPTAPAAAPAPQVSPVAPPLPPPVTIAPLPPPMSRPAAGNN